MLHIITKIKEKGVIGTLKAIRSKVINIPNAILMPAKLRKLVKDREYKIAQGLNIQEIRKKTLNYIETMRVKDVPYGQYKYSHGQNEPVLYASIYAALTRHLYRDIDELKEKQRKEWVNYIQSFQDDDGLFKDPAIKNDIAGNVDWWGWRHLTLHALMALTSLGATAEKKFKILEPFKSKISIIEWLNTKGPLANKIHKILNYFTFLQYARDFQEERWAEEPLQTVFEWLNKHQDRETGCWDTRFKTLKLVSEGIKIGYHVWGLYFYDRKPIQYVERIIDSCISTQNKFGGFDFSSNSSACDDIDSIDPLVRLSRITEYRRSEVYSALRKAIPWILANMNADGGFVFKRMISFMYGHQKMFSGKDESAMFPTWFRTLSLAYIGKCMPESLPGKFDWKFIKCPGLQFW